MTHRQPTRHDIGRMVEVSNFEDFRDGYTDVLQVLTYTASGPIYHLENLGRAYAHCRIPVTTPDPLAELSAWADRAAEAV